MKFEEIIRIFPNSLWIRPLFTIIPFNLWIKLKIGKFGLCFDTWTCVFNDYSISFRQLTRQKFEKIYSPALCTCSPLVQAVACENWDLQVQRHACGTHLDGYCSNCECCTTSVFWSLKISATRAICSGCYSNRPMSYCWLAPTLLLHMLCLPLVCPINKLWSTCWVHATCVPGVFLCMPSLQHMYQPYLMMKNHFQHWEGDGGSST